MVSAACLAGWQTILVFFSRELWVRRKRKETNGWKIKNATGRFLVQTHPSRFVSKVVCPIPNIAIEAGMFFLTLPHIEWPCKDYNFQNAGNGISEPPDFKIFWGSMPPDPARLMGLTAPCSYSRLFFFNQLPTSNFIEAPAQKIL